MFELTWISEDCAMLEFDSHAAASRWAAAVLRGRPDWLLEVSAGFGQVLIQIDSHIGLVQAAEFCQAIRPDSETTETHAIQVPVCYHPSFGLDLAEVAEHSGLSVDQVIECHQSTPLTVMAMGFAPGFAYMGAIDPRLRLPRKPTPRLAVPAGSLAIAEQKSVIYPTQTPGGWHIIGRSPARLIEYEPELKTLFSLGCEVRFKAISLSEYEAACRA